MVKKIKKKLNFKIKYKFLINCKRICKELMIMLKYYFYVITHIFNKNKPLVSIIVPYYDDLNTIDKLLNSIKKSGYKNHEVIVVNDGSKQDPSNICNKYLKVKYFYKEKTEGPGLTRNFGVNRAKGKYVFYADADDTLSKGALRYLVDYAERYNLSVVSGMCRRIQFKNKKINYWRKEIYTKKYINNKNNRSLLYADMIAVAKLYNLKDLRDSNITFEKGLYEDKTYIFKVYSYFEKIGIVNKLVYNWLVYDEITYVSDIFDYDNIIS